MHTNPAHTDAYIYIRVYHAVRRLFSCLCFVPGWMSPLAIRYPIRNACTSNAVRSFRFHQSFYHRLVFIRSIHIGVWRYLHTLVVDSPSHFQFSLLQSEPSDLPRPLTRLGRYRMHDMTSLRVDLPATTSYPASQRQYDDMTIPRPATVGLGSTWIDRLGSISLCLSHFRSCRRGRRASTDSVMA